MVIIRTKNINLKVRYKCIPEVYPVTYLKNLKAHSIIIYFTLNKLDFIHIINYILNLTDRK